MKHLIRLIALLLILANTIDSKSQTLEDHLKEGREAYRKFANTGFHKQYKANKTAKSYVVGDTNTFWRWNLTVMPPLWVHELATCRAVGDNSYIFVANSQWNTNMTQNDIDTILHYLEDVTMASNSMGLIEMDTTYFGPIPDELDNDPKVIFYFTNLGSFQGNIFDGYFSAFNQLTEAQAQSINQHSNECEMLYMSCSPVNPSSYINISVLSHELEHLIHFGQDPNEESWIDEGCGEYAMVLFGLPDPINDFPSNSNDNLIDWGNQTSDYIQTMLFITYLAEQTTGPAFIKLLVANTATNVSGVNSTLSSISYPLDFQEILTNWTIANFTDDTSFQNGEFGYDALDLPTFSTTSDHTLLPITLYNILEACAARYYSLPTGFSTLELISNFIDGGEWDVSLLAFDNNELKEVITSVGGVDFTLEQPTTYTLTKLIAVVTNKEVSISSKQFSIDVGEATGINENLVIDNSSFIVFPNPCNENTIIKFELKMDSYVSCNVFDGIGRKVKCLLDKKLKEGKIEIPFNTHDLSQGKYFIRLQTKDIVITKPVLITERLK